MYDLLKYETRAALRVIYTDEKFMITRTVCNVQGFNVSGEKRKLRLLKEYHCLPDLFSLRGVPP